MKSAWSHTYFIPLHMANDLTESLLVNSCFSPSLLRYTLWNDNHNKVTYKHSLLLTITILSLLRWEHSKAALLSTCRYTIWYCALWSLYCTPAPQTYSSYSRKAVPFEQHLPYSLTPSWASTEILTSTPSMAGWTKTKITAWKKATKR